MNSFSRILTASNEGLVNLFYPFVGKTYDTKKIARKLELTLAQMVCALGFNPNVREAPEIIETVGIASYEELVRQRNDFFANDIYHRLGIKDVLAVYASVGQDMQLLDVMQYLLHRRLENIENRIEQTVNSIVIERYKREMRAIYGDGVAQVDFAEERLGKTHSGFRALLNEVSMIVENRLIPVGDIFFRDTILPEEKRRLVSRGLIPRELVISRLEDEGLQEQERDVLEQQLRLLDPD